MTADKVWIVDDDRSIRWVLEKALMQEGLEATAFEDAQTLLNKLGKEKPHAIVTDIRMPGIDGLTLLAKIRLNIPIYP
jgi:two-component system nitrogen regulation response regulator GlnG